LSRSLMVGITFFVAFMTSMAFRKVFPEEM